MLDNFYFISTEVIDQIERNPKGPLPYTRVTRDRIAARRMAPFWGTMDVSSSLVFSFLGVATVPELVNERFYIALSLSLP